MSNTIDEIIKAAQAQATAAPAAAAVTATDLAVAAQAANAGQVSHYTPPVGGGSKSLEDLAAGATPSVACYIKLKYEGLYLGDDKTSFEELKVRLRGSEIVSFSSISFGDPVKYGRSYNGATEAFSGQNWGAFVNQAMAIGSKGPFDAAEVPLYAVEDIVSDKAPNKGKVLVKAGEVIGFTTSDSAMREVKNFIRSVILPLGKDNLIEGTVKLKPLKKGKNEWAVLEFGTKADWTVVDDEPTSE